MPDPQTKYTRLMALAEWLERDPELRHHVESLRADPKELAALARELAAEIDQKQRHKAL